MLEEIRAEPLDNLTTQAVAVAPHAHYSAIWNQYTYVLMQP